MSFFLLFIALTCYYWGNMNKHLLSPDKISVTERKKLFYSSSLVKQWVYLQDHGWGVRETKCGQLHHWRKPPTTPGTANCLHILEERRGLMNHLMRCLGLLVLSLTSLASTPSPPWGMIGSPALERVSPGQSHLFHSQDSNGLAMLRRQHNVVFWESVAFNMYEVICWLDLCQSHTS